MKTNLVIFVSTARLFNSFFTDDILDTLSTDFDLKVFSAPGVTIPKEIVNKLKARRLGFTSLESLKFSRKLQLFALDFETLCESKRVSSFEIRIRHRFDIPANEKIDFVSLTRKRTTRNFALAFCYLKPFQNAFRKVIRNMSDFDCLLLYQLYRYELTNSKRPKKALMLSGGAFGGIENTIVRYCKKKNICSYLVIDNWDNLSSKSIYWNLPNFIGVWGEEMKKDAIEIQKFEAHQVRIIGSSRIFANNTITLKSKRTKTSSVTFFGSGWQFSDELNLVKIAATTLSEVSPKMRLIYRPHPAYLDSLSIDRINTEIRGYPNTKLDSEFTVNYSNEDWYASDSLLHVQELIMNSKFVIGAHSTTLVEALYHGKKVVAYSASNLDIFKDGDAWLGYLHMLQVRGNPKVLEAKSINEFISRVKQAAREAPNYKEYDLPDSLNMINAVPNILPNFDSTYAIRLKKFLTLSNFGE